MTHSPISRQDLDAVRQPIESAKGLPNAVYADTNLFTFERDQVLGHNWAGLVFSSELPQDGYVLPVDFMGLSLVVFRTLDGEIKVFHNVCSHRGMKLVQKAGPSRGMVSCPYHCWTYDMRGALKLSPHIGGFGKNTATGFDPKTKGLKVVRSATWLGMVFVDLSGLAPEFDAYIEPLHTRWQGYWGEDALAQLQPAENGSHMSLEVQANWKLAVENYCESYHLPWVHPGLNSYSPLNQHYNLIINDWMSGQGTYRYALAETKGLTLPQFEAWPSEKAQQAEYVSLYPNVLLGLQIDHAFAIILQPLANNRTLEKLEISYIGERALADELGDCRDAVLSSWQEVFSEDIFAVEGMQQGRQSPAFDGGAFSPVLDGPTHHFHGWVADQYSRAEA